MEQYLHYFCGDAANANALNETEPLRITFYKATATFARSYAALAQNLSDAGYSDADAEALISRPTQRRDWERSVTCR